MKKASSDPSQATASHDLESPPDCLPFEVPGLNVATLKGEDPELFPPESPDRATRERENDLNDDRAKHPNQHGQSKGTDDGLELSYPPSVTPASPVLTTEATSETVSSSRQPGAEHVSSVHRTTLSAYDVDGVVNHLREPPGMQNLVATLVEPAPIAEVIGDSELYAPKKPRSGRPLWTGGLICVVMVAIILVIVLTRPDSGPSDPYQIMSVLKSDLPESSKTDILREGTPQYQAFNWLKGSDGVESLSDDRIRQRYALATLYYATNGFQWTRSSGWLVNDNECKWYFNNNTNNCIDGVLTTLNLNANSLAGVLPPDLSMLSNLTYLDLSGNALVRTIPSSLGQLASLTHLWLVDNKLIGTIPSSLGQLTSLAYLGLSSNALSGTIPSSLGQLTSLADLSLSSNSLTGTIPSSLGQLTSLTYLGLSFNALTGTIPSSLGQLASLEYLDLNDNALTGTIPSNVCAFVNLTFVPVDCDKVTCDCGSDICSCW